MLSLLKNITFNDICEILTIIGFIYYIVKRFILKQAPIPFRALSKVNTAMIEECICLLQKKAKEPGEPFRISKDLEERLAENLHDETLLKELLLEIGAHVGIDATYIKLKFLDDTTMEYAGNIATDGTWTTICLQLHSYYNLDVLTAVLAHEMMHLYLYYQGIRKRENLENEVLTDTAAVYFGYGEYLYRGYKVIETQIGFSYHKVGYIRTEDVRMIQERIAG